LGDFVVNGGAQINYFIPQIMLCIVYHYNPINVNAKNVSHGKDKGLVNHNKDHMEHLL
jgi:hypothetical protein